MAYIKAFLFLAVVVAAVMAAEEPVREKKAVYYGAGVYSAHDDGQWAPGKYEGVGAYYPAVHHAAPYAASPYGAYPYAAYPYAKSVYY